MRKRIEKKVLELVYETIDKGEDVPGDVLADRESMLMDLGYDSISMIHLQVEIEDEFRFMFDPKEDDFEEIFSTVGKLCDYVVQRVKSEKSWPGMG